jgi:hypothetical protein
LENAEIKGDYKKIGELLGYPSCCVESYCSKKFFSDAYLLSQALINSNGNNYFNFVNNVCREGKTIILHFPCSFNCKASIETGKAYLDSITKLDEEYLKKYKECLSGVSFIAENFVINFNNKSPKLNEETTDFIKKGIDAKCVALVDNNTLKVNGREYKGNLVYFK